MNTVSEKANDLIIGIQEYAVWVGVDFETALKMLNMMYEDGVHLNVKGEK